MFALAFFFLPMVLLYPSKFATSFTFGSICFMSAFAIWNGPKPTLRSLFSRERWFFTLVYVASIVATLYSALILRNYLAVIVSASAQTVALLWYGATYIPGGTAGMGFISSMVCRAAHSMTRQCFSAVGGARGT